MGCSGGASGAGGEAVESGSGDGSPLDGGADADERPKSIAAIVATNNGRIGVPQLLRSAVQEGASRPGRRLQASAVFDGKIQKYVAWLSEK